MPVNDNYRYYIITVIIITDYCYSIGFLFFHRMQGVKNTSFRHGCRNKVGVLFPGFIAPVLLLSKLVAYPARKRESSFIVLGIYGLSDGRVIDAALDLFRLAPSLRVLNNKPAA